MSAAKETFLRDKELSGKWSAWTQSQDGAKVFATANSELLDEPELNGDMIRGAKMYRHILEQLAEAEPPSPQYPSSGLEHDLEPPARTAKTK